MTSEEVRSMTPGREMDAAVRVVNRRREPFDVYIGRPSKWGNPFSHLPDTLAKFKVATRQEAIARYREWIVSQPELVEAARRELAGKVLGCWCKPQACHGDVLAEIIRDAGGDRKPLGLNAGRVEGADEPNRPEAKNMHRPRPD